MKCKSWDNNSSLTFDSEPSVSCGVAGLVGCRALEHARVLPPHVVDDEGTILRYLVPHCGDTVQCLTVSVPGDLRTRRPRHCTGNLQLSPNLSQSLELHLAGEVRLLCNIKI